MSKLKMLYRMDPKSEKYLLTAANIFGVRVAPSVNTEAADRFAETAGGAATSMARSQLGMRQ
jgi:hypothetical protein